MRALGASRTSLVPGGVLAGPWVRDYLWRRARAVSSLDLRFADNKSLTDAVTGASLVTFTRASSGTFVGSDGVLRTAATDVPRFDHNPITGESLGLLVEEQRSNLLLQSEDFSRTWIRTLITFFGSGSEVDVETAPDGTLTADLIAIASGSNSGTGFIGQTIAKSATATTYTVTVFAKAQNWNAVTLHVNDAATNNNRATVTFSLATGVITTAAAVFGTFSAASATPASSFADGWFKANLTFTSSTETGLLVRIFPNNSSTVTGDGTSGIYTWGAQIEQGAFPTSYIPTTTAAATRAADVASITGSAFSSWYRQDEGTMFINGVLRGILSQNYVVSISAGASGANAHVVFGVSGALRYSVAVSSDVQVNIALGSASVDDQQFIAASYQQNNFAAARNGVLGPSDTLGNLPTVDTLKIGTNSLNSAAFSGHIRRLVYWPVRLSNEVLQRITQ